MDIEDHDAVTEAFHSAVNMQPAEMERWLATEESRSVGWTHEGETEALGHEAGRRIVTIKRTRKADLTDDDYAHMRKVVGYVHRHMAQRPEGDVGDTRWRHSLAPLADELGARYVEGLTAGTASVVASGFPAAARGCDRLRDDGRRAGGPRSAGRTHGYTQGVRFELRIG